ncbi:MAG: hypothetical protein O7H41_05285 [Planctomycetota bacterium]|nr:hypothetical protein [Planctomycetota bacterium]
MTEQLVKAGVFGRFGGGDILDLPARRKVVLIGLLLIAAGVALGTYVSRFWGPIVTTEDLVGIILVASLLAVPGLGILAFAAFAILTDWIFGDIGVEVSPEDLRIGEELTVTVTFEPKFWGRIGGVFATIRAEEEDSDRVSHYTPKGRRVRFEKRLPLSRATEVAPGESLRWSRSFEIPRGSPITIQTARTSIVWSVVVRVSLSWWPDWKRRRTIVVHPHRSS